MENQIKTYLDTLFSSVPASAKAGEIKEEMLRNLTEKYQDLTAEGKTPEAAYQLTIDSIGDISGLLADLSVRAEEPADFIPDRTAFQPEVDSSSSGSAGNGTADTEFAQGHTESQEPFGNGGYQTWQSDSGAANLYTNAPQPKKDNTVKIVVICLVSAILVGLLVWLAMAGMFAFRTSQQVVSNQTTTINELTEDWLTEIREELGDDFAEDILEDLSGNFQGSGEVTTAETFEAGAIEKIEINWVSGNIEIVNGDAVSFGISHSGTLKSGEESTYKVTGKTLVINEYQDATGSFNIGFGVHNIPSKALVLTIPDNLKNLTIDTVSSNITFQEPVVMDKLSINTVSADVIALTMDVRKLEVDTVSGDLEFGLAFTQMPETITISAISGDTSLYFLTEGGFTATLDSVSGSLICRIPAETHDKTVTYGDGSCKITVDSVSGDLTIKQMD